MHPKCSILSNKKPGPKAWLHITKNRLFNATSRIYDQKMIVNRAYPTPMMASKLIFAPPAAGIYNLTP